MLGHCTEGQTGSGNESLFDQINTHSRCWHVIVPCHVRSTNKNRLSFHLGQSGSIFKMRAVWQKNTQFWELNDFLCPWHGRKLHIYRFREEKCLSRWVDQQTLSAQIHLLLVLLTLKHGEAVILMRKRHYRSLNQTHTMLRAQDVFKAQLWVGVQRWPSFEEKGSLQSWVEVTNLNCSGSNQPRDSFNKEDQGV